MIEAIIIDGIHSQLESLKTASQNITNATTPGYIRQATLEQYLNGKIAVSTQVASSQLQGMIKQTGREHDFAVLNSGLFVVELNGELMLTQDGRYHVDESGILRHISGAIAMSTQGPIQANDTDDIADQFWLVTTDQPYVSLEEQGQGLYQVDWQQWQNSEKAQVVAKSLNLANRDAATDSVHLLKIQRNIESLQKAYQTYDSTLSYGISELGRK
jgi:flagellar basal body rod protein FlgG